jgi:uncharacterized membrane protein YfcA
MTALLLAPVLGLVVGLVMGALGGGGAVVSVPVLVYLLHQPVREATTISLVVVLFGAAVGLVGLRGTGRVDWRTGLVFGGLGLGGSVLGSRASVLVDPRVLLAGFALLLAVVGVLTWLHARRPEASAEGAAEVSLTQLVPTAFGVGALTGFFGVGGGFVTVPALTLVMRLPVVVATSTSLVVIAVNATAALVTRVLGGDVGDVPWGLVVTFALGTGLGTWLGSRVSGRAGGPVLLRAFAVFLVVLAVLVGAEAFRG